MPTFGLISRKIGQQWRPGLSLDLIESHETRNILRAAEEFFDHSVVINPLELAVDLPRGEERPRIFVAGAELEPVHTLMVRSTGGLLDALGGAVRALVEGGADLLDPIERMAGDSGTKLYTTFDRFTEGVGTTTSMAFGPEAARDLVCRLDAEGRLPLLAKPVRGRKGRGVTLLRTLDEAQSHIDQVFSESKGDGRPVFFVQHHEPFIAEYRVMVFFGEALGVARKVPADGALAANAAQGGAFVASDRSEVASWAAAHVHSIGILGVDVGELEGGELRVIEANRAPLWESFDRALGVDCAREVMRRARQRLEA